MTGVKNAVRQSGTHASFSVFDCDKYIERKLLAFATHTRSRQGGRVRVPDCTRASLVHVHVKRKSGRLFIDLSVFQKRGKLTGDHLYGHFLVIEMYRGTCEADSTALALLSFRGVFPLFSCCFFIKSARKLVVEPPIYGGFEPHCCCCDACWVLSKGACLFTRLTWSSQYQHT